MVVRTKHYIVSATDHNIQACLLCNIIMVTEYCVYTLQQLERLLRVNRVVSVAASLQNYVHTGLSITLLIF